MPKKYIVFVLISASIFYGIYIYKYQQKITLHEKPISANTHKKCCLTNKLQEVDAEIDKIGEGKNDHEELISNLNLLSTKLKNRDFKDSCEECQNKLVNIENKKLKILADIFKIVAQKRIYFKNLPDITPIISPSKIYHDFFLRTKDARTDSIDLLLLCRNRFKITNQYQNYPSFPEFEWPESESYTYYYKTMFQSISKYGWDGNSYTETIFKILEPIDEDLYKKYDLLLDENDLIVTLAILSNQIIYDIQNENSKNIHTRVDSFLKLVTDRFQNNENSQEKGKINALSNFSSETLINRINYLLCWTEISDAILYKKYHKKFQEFLKLNKSNPLVINWAIFSRNFDEGYLFSQKKLLEEKNNRQDIIPILTNLFDYHKNRIQEVGGLITNCNTKDSQIIYQIIAYIFKWTIETRKHTRDIFPINLRMEESNLFYKEIILSLAKEKDFLNNRNTAVLQIIQDWANGMFTEVFDNDQYEQAAILFEQFKELQLIFAKNNNPEFGKDSGYHIELLLKDKILAIESKLRLAPKHDLTNVKPIIQDKWGGSRSSSR